MPRIRFQGGINRLRNADASEPYDLRNAELDVRGVVRALKAPEDMAVKVVNYGKPYFEWGGGVLDRREFAGDFIHAGDDYDGRLFLSASDETDIKTAPHVKVLPSDYPTTPAALEPALVKNTGINVTSPSVSGDTVVAHSKKFVIGYLIIPFNAKGEAGPFHYFTTGEQNYLRLGSDPTETKHPFMPLMEIFSTCNAQSQYVEVYRTLNMSDESGYSVGNLTTDFVISGETINYGKTPDKDHRFFYLGRHDVVDIGGGVLMATFRDSGIWITENQFSRAFDGLPGLIVTDALDHVGGVAIKGPKVPQINLGYPGLGDADSHDLGYVMAPTEALDRQLNLHGQVWGGTEYSYRGFAAKAMYNHAGVMMYGNITWPCKEPQVFFTAGSGVNTVSLQYEYETASGTVYGPVRALPGTPQRLLIPWQGEAAVNVYLNGITRWERLVPDLVTGMYYTEYARSGTDTPLPLSFDAAASRGTNPPIDLIKPSTSYVTEPNVVMLAAQNRPHELTYDQFQTPDDSAVVAISPLRMAEGESLRAYDFLVATDRRIDVYSRSGRDVVPSHEIFSNLGVKTFSRTLDGLTYETPVIATVRGGVCFAGTDEFIYLLRGRQTERLDYVMGDQMVAPITASSVIADMTYDQKKDELWVLVSDEYIFRYDFITRKWRGAYHYASPQKMYQIWYQESGGFVVAFFDVDGTYVTLKNLKFNESGAALAGHVVTQPLDEGATTSSVVHVEADYDPFGFDPANSATWIDHADSATWMVMRHSIRKPDVLAWHQDFASPPAYVNYKYEVRVPRARPVYPVLLGTGHQFKFSNFDELREVDIVMQEVR